MTQDETLQNFLNTWSLERVKKMTLEEYNKQGSKVSFCYMLEFGTKNLGNISGGATSAKFEIYDRKDKSRVPKTKDLLYDDIYTWRKRAGESREAAFKYTKDIIVSIIKSSEKGNFSEVDGRKLAPLVVWKIAFLYSNKQLLSISDRTALKYVAKKFDMPNYINARTSAVHNFLMKTVDFDRYWETMDDYWEIYKENKDLSDLNKTLEKSKGTDTKDVALSKRFVAAKTLFILKNHNKLQQQIYDELEKIHGTSKVTMEEQNIDIKVEYESSVDFYEVKIASSAKYCIREAIGQLLEYAYHYKTTKTKRCIIVGNHQLLDLEGYFTHLQQVFSPMTLEYQFKQLVD